MHYLNVNTVAEMIAQVGQDPGTPPGVQAWAMQLHDILASAPVPIERFVKGSAMPTSLGPLADEYAVVRERRLSLDKEAAAVKSRETEIYNCILGALVETQTGDTGAAGHTHRVQLVMKERYVPQDWPSFHAMIQQTGAFELLQKRVADTAMKEWSDANDGTLPAGITTSEVATLSFNKV